MRSRLVRTPPFPGDRLRAALAARELSLAAVCRAAGYRSPGARTRLSRFIRGLEVPGQNTLARILHAAGIPVDEFEPWLERRKMKTLVCRRCGKVYERTNLRPEENAKLRRRADGKWEGLQCADCGSKSAAVNPRSVEARTDTLYVETLHAVADFWDVTPDEARAVVLSEAPGDRAKVKKARAARLERLRRRYTPQALERRRQVALASPDVRARRAFRIWLGRVLRFRPIRRLRLCRLCGLLVRPAPRTAERSYHAVCWQTVMGRWRRRKTFPPEVLRRETRSRPGPPPERNLDRDLYFLLSTRADKPTLLRRDILARAHALFPAARRLKSLTAVTKAVDAVIDRVPGDATLFLALPGAAHFARAVCGPSAGTSLVRLLSARIQRGNRDGLIRSLHDQEMSVENISRVTGADAERVQAAIGAAAKTLLRIPARISATQRGAPRRWRGGPSHQLSDHRPRD